MNRKASVSLFVDTAVVAGAITSLTVSLATLACVAAHVGKALAVIRRVLFVAIAVRAVHSLVAGQPGPGRSVQRKSAVCLEFLARIDGA